MKKIILITFIVLSLTACTSSKEYDHQNYSLKEITTKIYTHTYSINPFEEKYEITNFNEQEIEMLFTKELAYIIEEVIEVHRQDPNDGLHKFILVRLKKEGQKNEVELILKDYMNSITTKTKKEDQIIEESIVKSIDNLVIMIVSEKADEIEKYFDKIIKGTIKLD